MPKEFALRNKIAEAKAEFHEKGGRDEYWLHGFRAGLHGG